MDTTFMVQVMVQMMEEMRRKHEKLVQTTIGEFEEREAVLANNNRKRLKKLKGDYQEKVEQLKQDYKEKEELLKRNYQEEEEKIKRENRQLEEEERKVREENLAKLLDENEAEMALLVEEEEGLAKRRKIDQLETNRQPTAPECPVCSFFLTFTFLCLIFS